MKNKELIDPASVQWLDVDDYPVANYFKNLGFSSLQQILDMRVYDLMNMNGLDHIRVEETITCLYRFLNNNPSVDLAMYDGAMRQTFDFSEWRKTYKDSSTVAVADIVFSDNMNLKALQHIYDVICRKFYRSDEYVWRNYRFYDYMEYLEARRNGGKKR